MESLENENRHGRDKVSADDDFQGNQVRRTKCYKGNFKADVKELIQTSWPIILLQVCQLLLSPISLMFCGHLGDPIKLEGAALAISVINCTVVSVGHGMGTACDTVFSQTIRSKNKPLVGVYAQRALLVFTLMSLPFYALHINIEALLLLVGQHPEAARLAGEYILIFMPGALCFFAYVVLSKYLLNMDILLPNVLISISANVVNALLHYVLMYHLDFGLRGSAVSLATAYIVNLVLTVAYIVVSGSYKDTWKGWTRKCLDEWGPLFKLSISGMLMVGMEWWAFELGLLLSGILGTFDLGAQSIVLQFDQLWYQVPLSIEIACSIKVGQRLGSGNSEGAKAIGWLAVSLTVAVSVIPMVLFFSIPRQLTSIFTNIPEIIELTAKLLPLVGIYVLFDGISCACKGVMTGTGRQSISAILIFISYYVIALPIGIPLMFLTALGVAAYWIGLSINMVVQSIVLLIIIPKTDWKEQKRRAFERNKTESAFTEERKYLTASNKEDYTTELRFFNGTLRSDTPAPLASVETLNYSLASNGKPLLCTHILKLIIAIGLLLLLIGAVVIRLLIGAPLPPWNPHIHAGSHSLDVMRNGTFASTETVPLTSESI